MRVFLISKSHHKISRGGAYVDPDAAALVASIEKTIGPLPVLTGPGSWNAVAAAKAREYIHELKGRRELNFSLHQMLGGAHRYPGNGCRAPGPPAPSYRPHPHSMTSSARASISGGIVSPRALAVFRLMSNKNFVGCSIGRSAGLAPFRILST